MKRKLHWLLVCDAGPAYAGPFKANVPFLIAYRLHLEDTGARPIAMGTALIGESGINRAEYLAVIHGLRALLDLMKLEDYAPLPVIVLTDSAIVARQAIGPILGAYYSEFFPLTDELKLLSSHRVQMIHNSDESKEAHNLVSRFRDICDKAVKDYWKDRKRREWAKYKSQ